MNVFQENFKRNSILIDFKIKSSEADRIKNIQSKRKFSYKEFTRKNSIIKQKDEYKIGTARGGKLSNRLLDTILEDQNAKEMKEQHKTTNQILIDEINKESTIGKNELRRRRVIICDTEDGSKKDIDRINYLLKNSCGFKRFMIYNHVDEEAVRIAANFLTHRRIKKGEYVFKQGDDSKHFYGIIDGKISLRLNKKHFVVENVNPVPVILHQGSNPYNSSFMVPEQQFNKVYSYKKEQKTKEIIKEEEILCLTEGHCFGEWGLIHKTKRATSAFALEQTDLFVLDDESFNLSFGKCLFKAEMDKKAFILKRVNPFAELSSVKFHILYKTMIPMFFAKHQLIFLENSPATKILIVYSGSCVLQTNVKSLNEEDKNDFSKMKFQTLLKIDKGDVIGLEALYSDNYKYTLKSESDQTVIIAITPSKLDESMFEKVKVFFKNINSNFENNIKNIIERKNNLDVRSKFKLRISNKFKGMSDMKYDEQQFFDEKVMQTLEDFRKLKINNNENKKFRFNTITYANEEKPQTIVPKIKLSFKTKTSLVLGKFDLKSRFSTLQTIGNEYNNFKTIEVDSPSKFGSTTYKGFSPGIKRNNTGTTGNETMETLSITNRFNTEDCSNSPTIGSPYRPPDPKNKFNYGKRNSCLRFLTLSSRKNEYSSAGNNKNNDYSPVGIRNSIKNRNSINNENSLVVNRNSLVGNRNNIINERSPVGNRNSINNQISPVQNRNSIKNTNGLINNNVNNSNYFNFNGSISNVCNSNDGNSNTYDYKSPKREILKFDPTKMSKLNLNDEHYIYNYDDDPILLSQTIKTNIKVWNKVVKNKANFNTGYFDIPLVGMIDKKGLE